MHRTHAHFLILASFVAACQKAEAPSERISDEDRWIAQLAPLQTEKGGREHDQIAAIGTADLDRILEQRLAKVREAFVRAAANSNDFLERAYKAGCKLNFIQHDAPMESVARAFRLEAVTAMTGAQMAAILRMWDDTISGLQGK